MGPRKKELSYDQIQLILGTLLGDAGLHCRLRNSHKQFEFYVAHGIAQHEYITHQANLLGVKVGTYYKSQKSYSPGGAYYRFSYSNKKELQKIYELCFESGKKCVTAKWLKQIGPAAIAYWFMDDGSSSFDVTNSKAVIVRFSSQSFSKEENLLLMEKLLDFGIETTLRKVPDGTGYNIYVRQKSVNTLMDLVEPYITFDTKYKIKRRKEL